jgi:thioredoxin reductase (NADPH)
VGDGSKLTGILLTDNSGKQINFSCSGAFIAIGHQPNSSLFKGKLAMDENGYLITKGKSSKTSIEGVFACGDIQDHEYRQAISAAGSGCIAAIDAERYLESLPHYEKL